MEHSKRCSIQNVESQYRQPALVELIAHGFYKFTPTTFLDQIKDGFIDSGDPFADETNRVVVVDGEDVFERGGSAMIEKCRPLLECRGINLMPMEDKDTSLAHGMILGSTFFKLWTFDEIEQSSSRWNFACDKVLQMLDSVFQTRGAEDRWFIEEVHSNYKRVVLISPSQENILRRIGGLK